MRSRASRGMTLVELMVMVLVVALLMAIVVTYLGPSGTSNNGRRVQCQNNLRNIGLALVNYHSSKNRFPNAATFEDDPEFHVGDPLRSTIYRAIADPGAPEGGAEYWLRSWVVDILPYIDAQDMYNAWNFQQSYLGEGRPDPASPNNATLAGTAIGILRCPEDPTAPPGRGNLSYVVNGGFARWYAVPVGWSGSPSDGKSANGGTLGWSAPGGSFEGRMAVARKLGVMFPGTSSGDQPWDIATTPADIIDGHSNTLLVAENTLAGYSPGTPHSGGRETNWACPLPNFAMFVGSDDVCRTPRSETDCLGGQLRPRSLSHAAVDGPGWSRANQAGTFENINFGQRLTVEGSFPFANSPHPDGCNMVFCDGAVRFISRTIDGSVYAKIITPGGGRLSPECRQLPIDPDDFSQ